MEKISPMQFAREVRQEALKVTWPTRKETVVTTAMVLVMVLLAAVFFFTFDQVLSTGARHLFGGG